jgi:glycosyltransferase involved in cell wall biosynthesis
MNLAARLRSAAPALGVEIAASASRKSVIRSLATLAPSLERSYLILSAAIAGTPEPSAVVMFSRRWAASGLDAAISRAGAESGRVRVRITDATVVDVTDTSASPYTTGIQRVARETSRRWAGRGAVMARWSDGESRLRALDDADVLIPYRGTFVLPEISVSARRTSRLRTIGLHSASRSVAIGFDCIPVTTAETAGIGMPGAFSGYLASLAAFDVVVPISEASAEEYRGWSRMLDGAGLTGPTISPRALPNSFASDAVARSPLEVRADLGVGDDVVVLAVGSTEPRKNHLRLLAAAELSWRAGHRFSLVLVGGNSWNTTEFDDLLERLLAAGRPVVKLSRIGDDDLAALYALARFTVFPSLNEGFGLPIVESIAAGTPVITSEYGSMRALAEGYGGVLVDPRSIDGIARAMSALLEDDAELARLTEQTSSMPRGSWAAYADQVWEIVRNG